MIQARHGPARRHRPSATVGFGEPTSLRGGFPRAGEAEVLGFDPADLLEDALVLRDARQFEGPLPDTRRAVGPEEALPVRPLGQLDRDGHHPRPATDDDPRLLDRDEAREGRHQRVPPTESDDLRLDCRWRRSLFHGQEVRGQDVLDLGPAPERRDRGMVGRLGLEPDRDSTLVATCTGVPRDDHRTVDRRRRDVVAGMEQDRACVEEIRQETGWVARQQVERGDALHPNLDVGEDRRLESLHEPIHHGVRTIGQEHVVHGAAALPGHRIEQETVRAVPDAEREHPRGPGVLANGLHDALVVPDVAVGQEDDDPHRRGDRLLDEARLGHFVAPQAVDDRPPTVQLDQRVGILDRGQDDRKAHRDAQPLAHRQPSTVPIDLQRRVRRGDRDHPAVRRRVGQFDRAGKGRTVLDEGASDRLHHLGAPAPFDPVDESLCREAVLLRRGSRRLPEDLGPSREGDDVEGVVRSHRIDRLPHHGLRLLDREPAHRSRGVQDEDEFTRTNLLGRHPGGRRQHHREVAARLHALVGRGAGDQEFRSIAHGHVGEDALRDRVVGQSPPKDEVPVGDRLAVGEGDADAIVPDPGFHHLVQRRLDRLDGDATRVDRDRDRDVVTRPDVGTHRHRGDPARVRHLVGVGREPCAGLLRDRRLPVEPAIADPAVSTLQEREELGNDVADPVPSLDGRVVLDAAGHDHRRFAGRGERRSIDPHAGREDLEDAVRRPEVAHQPIGGVGIRIEPSVHPGCEGRDVEALDGPLQVVVPVLGGREGHDPSRSPQHDAASRHHAVGHGGRRTARAARDVPGTDDGGELEGVLAVPGVDDLEVADLDGDRRARLDVRHGLREDVGPLLLEQGGDEAGVAGLLVDRAGECPFLHLALHDAFATVGIDDGHGHRMHRRPVGHRERVDRLDRRVVGVRISLSDRYRDDRSADLGLDVGVLQRTGADELAAAVEGVEATAVGNLDDACVQVPLRIGQGEHGEHRDDHEERRGEDAPSGHERGGRGRGRPAAVRASRPRAARDAGVDAAGHALALRLEAVEEPVATRTGRLDVVGVPVGEKAIELAIPSPGGISVLVV